MNRTELLALAADLKRWAAERKTLSAREAAHLVEAGVQHPSPAEWENSDDEAARLCWGFLDLFNLEPPENLEPPSDGDEHGQYGDLR